MKNIHDELQSLLTDKAKRSQVLSDYGSLRVLLGNGGASGKAALLMTRYLHALKTDRKSG
jgi:hypothetical protein